MQRLVITLVCLTLLAACGRSSMPRPPEGADASKSPTVRHISPTEFDPLLERP